MGECILRVFIKRPVTFFIIFGLLFSSISFFLQPLSPFSSIAHRGASVYAPENTMASFHKAIELGFDFIEFDVRISKDGELVVIHDPKVNRTTNGDGFVHDLSSNELKKLDAGSWFHSSFSGERIPLLSEVLEEFGGKVGLLIDVKQSEVNKFLNEKLAQLLQTYFDNGLNPSTIKVQSFQVNQVKHFSTLCPDVSVGIVVNKTLNMFQLASYRNFASFISIHHQLITEAFIKQAKYFDYEVYSWTIKEQFQFIAMQRLSVNGIISNLEQKDTLSNRYITALFEKGQKFLRIFV